jgi:uncharacterized protein with PIN domain
MEGFLADMMLMRLARWLRLLGQDVANPKTQTDASFDLKAKGDDELMIQASRENRTLLTRDKRLFERCKRRKVPSILIRSSKIAGQLLEMQSYGIKLELHPKNCTICNYPLKETITSEIPAQGPAWECARCKKLYWQGSHWKGMQNFLTKQYIDYTERTS